MLTRSLAAVVLSIFVAACGFPDTSTNTSNSSQQDPVAPSHDGVMRAMAYLVSENFVQLHNQNFVGQAAGPKDLRTDCPLGGKVHMLGYTTVSNLSGNSGTNSGTDMRFGMAACGVSGGKGNLTYTTPSTEPVEGSSIHQKGNWTTQFGVLTSKTETISGTADITGNMVLSGQTVPIDEKGCQFSVTSTLSGGVISGDKLSGGTWTFSGVMCGVQFNQRFTE